MKKRFWMLDTLLVLLTAACLTLTVALAWVKPVYVLPALVVFALVALAVALFLRQFRKMLAGFLRGGAAQGAAQQNTLAALPLPVMIAVDGRVSWYNDAFLDGVAGGEDTCLLPVAKVLPGLDPEALATKAGQDFVYGGQRYTVYGAKARDGALVAYFVNDTVLKSQADEYFATRPAVLLIEVDTYDELLKEMRDSERMRILGNVDAALDEFVGATTGFYRKLGTARYLAVVEERHLEKIVKSRFSILDKVRAMGQDADNPIATLSIGVGRGASTLAQAIDMAAQALDMALGRGGDQAAVRSEDGFEFYGGVSRSVEKRSKVKSRIISSALRDLMEQSENVLIMGHKNSDLDAVGAAVGIWRFAKLCQKPAAVVVDEEHTLAQKAIDELRRAGEDVFLKPQEALDRVYAKTLLVIVDTHIPGLLESRQLYDAAHTVVVIDHHRKCVGHIEDSVIFYHEPYASSASELVSELLQYLGGDKENRLTPTEAQTLLAGIMLDTRNFALHTGVRTFEAAAYLRRMGAQTPAVKKLFNSSFEEYAYKAELVTDAEIYLGCAVVFKDHLPPGEAVAVPQAANDLLTIDGVQASFVAVDTGAQISVSARSMGEVNVQVILEKLGGGGHLTMAGAQLKDCTLEEARRRLLEAIAEYREHQQHQQDKNK